MTTTDPSQQIVGESSSLAPSYDLADHFFACAKLGRYLTVTSGTRFIITDDFQDKSVNHEAAAVAAIYSKDNLIAEAALMPLSGRISHLSGKSHLRAIDIS